MLVNFEGAEYDFDIEAIDVAEASHIKRATGLSVKKMLEGLVEVDPDACKAAHWLMLKQNGKVTDMNKVNFPILKFAEAVGEAYDEETGAQEENPTEAEPAANQA